MPATSKFDPLVWGISLIAFAIGVVAGTIVGGKYRYSWAIMEVPWGNKEEEDVPTSPQEAWVWISFANDALASGVSAEQVRSIYRRTKQSGKPIDTENIPWPSYSRTRQHKERPRIERDDEGASDEEYPPPPPPRPGASPR